MVTPMLPFSVLALFSIYYHYINLTIGLYFVRYIGKTFIIVIDFITYFIHLYYTTGRFSLRFCLWISNF